MIQRMVRENHGKFKRCYEAGLAHSFGAFFTWAFYDQNVGNLVGAYSSTDTGPEMCAGTVPNGPYLTD